MKRLCPTVKWLKKEPSALEYEAALATNKALEKLAAAAAPFDPASKAVGAAVNASKLLAAAQYPSNAKNKKWLHPSTILFWWANGDKVKFNLSDEMVIAAMVKHYCVPSDVGRKMNEWLKGSDVFNAPFPRKIHAPSAPKGKVLRGYKLKSLIVQITNGVNFVEVHPDRAKVIAPLNFENRKIDFTSSANKERFGEVWLAISNDGKGMWICSDKLPVMSFDELKKQILTDQGQVTGLKAYPLDFNELNNVPGRKLPDQIEGRIKQPSTATLSIP